MIKTAEGGLEWLISLLMPMPLASTYLKSTVATTMYTQSHFEVSNSSLYPESFTDGTGIFDSIESNRSKEDIDVFIYPEWL